MTKGRVVPVGGRGGEGALLSRLLVNGGRHSGLLLSSPGSPEEPHLFDPFPRIAMRPRIVTRRQVLMGAGGFTLGLPFLPSLLTRPAYGQDPVLAPEPRFLALTSQHGGVFETAMFPDEGMLTDSEQLYPGHEISKGALTRSVAGDRASLSTILSGSSTVLSDALVSKLNVLRGLDIPFYIAHHTGGYLGNYARNDGNGDQGVGLGPMPTIDQLMAWSPSFYPNLDSIRLRSIVAGRGRMSYMWSSPSDRSGEIEEVRTSDNAHDLFSQVFVPDEPSMVQEPKRPLILERVNEHYRALRDGNRRLGSKDKQRLDDHMERLSELERKLSARPQAAASCGDLQEPTGGDGYANEMRALLDVVVAGFVCGTSRIAVIGIDEANFASDGNDWHQGVAHQWQNEDAQRKLQEANQGVFEQLFLYVTSRLDVEESPGRTVLDDSLVMWSQESGESTHDSRSIPVITAGSAAGALNTGLYADYRNKTDDGIVYYWSDPLGYSGLLYNQWLATILQSMGMPASEWQNVENNANSGYGYPQFAPEYGEAQVSGVIDNASEMLPFLAAT